MDTYLNSHGYTIIESLPQDASARSYHRVQKNGNTAMLMVSPPEENRIGHRIVDFVTIAKWLRDIDLKAPEIYDVDEKNGFVLLEDLGSVDFKTAMRTTETPQKLYSLGYEVLKYLSDKKPPFPLPHYFDSTIHHGHRQIIDWYIPALLERTNPDGLTEEYWSIWQEIEKTLPPCPDCFLHMDYHVENLMWIPQEKGLKQCGLLDFQAGVVGPAPYDLVNLLKDARMDVPQDIQNSILKQYNEDFRLWFAVLATHFHSRVIGLFVKLPIQKNKMKYLEHIPRLQNYLYQELQHPVLKPIKSFFDDLGVDFHASKPINIDKAKSYIRSDAYDAY